MGLSNFGPEFQISNYSHQPVSCNGLIMIKKRKRLFCSDMLALDMVAKRQGLPEELKRLPPSPLFLFPPLQSSISQNFHRFVPCLHFSKTAYSLVHLHFPCHVFVSAPLIFFQQISQIFRKILFYISRTPLFIFLKGLFRLPILTSNSTVIVPSNFVSELKVSFVLFSNFRSNSLNFFPSSLLISSLILPHSLTACPLPLLWDLPYSNVSENLKMKWMFHQLSFLKVMFDGIMRIEIFCACTYHPHI